MEVTTSIREDDGKTQVTVAMTADEVKEHIDRAFKSFSKTRIPGFRAGKAPRKVLIQNFGGHDVVYEQITSDMINDVAPVAIDGEDILFVADPEFEDNGLVADGEGFTFTLFGEVKPSITLNSYDPVAIDMPPEEATEADLKQQLEALQQYYYSFETVDRAAKEGDYVMVALQSSADGEDAESLTNENRLVELGGSGIPEELSEGIVGMKAGDVKELDYETDYYPELKGKAIHTKASVKEVRVKETPELDDEFAEKVGFESFEKLSESLKEQIAKQKEEQLPRLKESRCVTALSKRIDGEIPSSYINYIRGNILQDFFNSLQDQGTTFDQFLMSQGITSDQFKEDLDQQATEEAEESLALDALYVELGLEITDEDIDKEFAAVSDPQGTRKAWEEAGRMSVIREAIRRQRATQWLVENAVVTIVDGADDKKKDEE